MNKPIQVFWYCEKWQAGGIQTIQVRLLDHMPLDQIHFDIAVSENDKLHHEFEWHCIRHVQWVCKPEPGKF